MMRGRERVGVCVQERERRAHKARDGEGKRGYEMKGEQEAVGVWRESAVIAEERPEEQGGVRTGAAGVNRVC